jgi:hypothetical protein
VWGEAFLHLAPPLPRGGGGGGVRFAGSLYHDQPTLVAAVLEACSLRPPDLQALESCVAALMAGAVSAHIKTKRGRFTWHVSKGPRVKPGKITSQTCSVFGTKDADTGDLVVGAIGRHGRGPRLYILDHWRDPEAGGGKGFEL